MSADIILNTNSFGKRSDKADTLIIEVSENHIRFCEMDAVQNLPLWVVYYPFDSVIEMSPDEHLINAVKHFQFSKKSYNKVLLNSIDKLFTLCPTAFYKADDARSLLEFNVGSVGNRLVLTDDINSDVKLIYAIDEQLKSVLDKLYPQHQLKHSLTVLSKLMLSSDEFSKDGILLSLQNNCIEFVVKQDHKLLLANQYTVKTQEDVLYYLLFILEQYQLNPLFVNVSLMGNVEADAPLIKSLKKYIKHVHLAKGHKLLNWSNVEGMPQHFNYLLLNRVFCE